MKRSKSYTWLSTLLKPKEVEPREDEEWGAVPWIRANELMQDERLANELFTLFFEGYKEQNIDIYLS